MALSALSARCVRSARAMLLAGCALFAVGCNGELVNLGNSEPLQAGGDGGSAGTMGAAGATQGGRAPLWGAPELILAEDGVSLANATFDAGMTELFYSHQPHGSETTAIYRADGPDFRNGSAVTFADLKMADEVNPVVSASGTQLWLGMLGPSGNTDIYLTTGEKDSWSKPQRVTELSSDLGDDVPRPPAVGQTIMPLSSKRYGGKPNVYQIYFSTRDDVNSPWGEPKQDFLDAINVPPFQSADGFLTEDGRELYFASNRGADGHHDLYVAVRPSVDMPFGDPQPLLGLNTEAALPDFGEERMPWLTPSEDRLYFASNRSGQYALYVSARLAP